MHQILHEIVDFGHLYNINNLIISLLSTEMKQGILKHEQSTVLFQFTLSNQISFFLNTFLYGSDSQLPRKSKLQY